MNSRDLLIPDYLKVAEIWYDIWQEDRSHIAYYARSEEDKYECEFNMWLYIFCHVTGYGDLK